MKTNTEKERVEKNWVLPGTKLTHKELLEGIKKAEEGPFMTTEEFETSFYKWRNEKYK